MSPPTVPSTSREPSGAVASAEASHLIRARTAFWLGFACAYVATSLLFGLYLAATNPKMSPWEAAREGLTWPVTMLRDVLESGRFHVGPAPVEPCGRGGDCDVS